MWLPRLTARPLWPLRTALVCFLTSVPHLFLDRTGFVYNQLLGSGLLFAAIFAAFVSGPTWGGTLRNGFLALRGTVLAAVAVTAVIAVAGTSPTAVYVALVLGSVVIVTPVLQPVSTRMAWAIYTAGLALALERRGEYELTLALRVAFVSVVGIVVAVLCTLPPWPHSRATQASSSSLAAAGRDVSAAVDTLTYVLHPSGKACHSAVRAHASRLLASSATHTDAGAGLLLEVAWECGPARALGRHVALLRQCDVFAHGMSMAVDAQREEDAHQAELLTHVHRAKSGVIVDGGSRAGGDDVGSRVRSLTDEQVAVLQSYSEQAETMDTMLAGVCAGLARALGDVLEDILDLDVGRGSTAWRRWRPWAAQPQGDDCTDGRVQRREVLRQALVAFDQAVTDVRKALFYAPVEGPQRAEAQARIEVSLAVLGPRTGRYLLLFCLRAMATHVLSAAAAPAVPPSSAPPAMPASPSPAARSPRRWGRAVRGMLASYGLPPDVPRMIYVLKLTGAVTAALAAGTAIDGSGVWSALSVAFIAPRDHADKHAGGSFRTAALRLSGTIVGSIWGFMAYSVAASAHSVSRLQRELIALVLLAVGVFVFGLARFSPRHAYGAIVAQFTPYVMGDIPPGVLLQHWAIKRIQLNIVGVLIFVFIELFIFPRRAPVALRGELAAGLVAARSAVATVWEVQLGAGGVAACPTCCLSSAADVAAQVAALTSGVQRMRALLTEIGDEADWAPLSVSPVPVPPLRPCMALVDDFSALAVLLGLMHGVLANAGGDGEGEDTHGAALGRLVTPCAPALRALLSRVWEHYSALEEDLAAAVSPKQRLARGMAPQSLRGGSGPGAQHARAVALARMETALAGFEARTSAVFVSMLRSHRAEAAPVVPSTVMVPFLALCLCTRFLVHNAQHIARHASEMLDMPYSLPPRLDVDGGGCEGRGENGGDFPVAVPLLDDDGTLPIPAAGPRGFSEDGGDSSMCPVCHRARVSPMRHPDLDDLDDSGGAAFVPDDDVEARPRGWDGLAST